jgi:hypothetical protein
MDKKILKIFCVLAGTMDSMTGLLLIAVPDFALKLMQISEIHPEALIFVRFVGAFVFGVGFLYLFSLVAVRRSGDWQWVRSCLLSTAWLRLVIFVFGSVAISCGALSWRWGTVPLTDGVLAAFQLWIVSSGRIPGND